MQNDAQEENQTVYMQNDSILWPSNL